MLLHVPDTPTGKRVAGPYTLLSDEGLQHSWDVEVTISQAKLFNFNITGYDEATLHDFDHFPMAEYAKMAAMACVDLKQSGRETDIDCGGPDCFTCGPGAKCGRGSDCASGVCGKSRCTGVTTSGNQVAAFLLYTARTDEEGYSDYYEAGSWSIDGSYIYSFVAFFVSSATNNDLQVQHTAKLVRSHGSCSSAMARTGSL
jgi:hypothetical protein